MGERFTSFLNHPDRPWGPPSLLFCGYRVSFLGKKRQGRDSPSSPLSGAEVKNERSYTSTPSPLCLHGVYYIIYFTLNTTEYFCPLYIFNPSSKMAVKIRLHAPVFLTTLAFNHKMGEWRTREPVCVWHCTNLHQADKNGISARITAIAQNRVIILSTKYHLLLPAAIPAHFGRSGELTR